MRKNRVFAIIYVYYLMDRENNILYCGQTGDPKQRMKGHRSTKTSPAYKRTDVRMHIICQLDSRYQAQMLEHHLQKLIYIDKETDLEKNLRGCRKGAANPQREGRVKGGERGGLVSGPMLASRVYTLS